LFLGLRGDSVRQIAVINMDLLVMIDEDDEHLLTKDNLSDEGIWDFVEANLLGVTLRAAVERIHSVEVENA
jgi:hypothetical protein